MIAVGGAFIEFAGFELIGGLTLSLGVFGIIANILTILGSIWINNGEPGKVRTSELPAHYQ